jgi:hypothetical protein
MRSPPRQLVAVDHPAFIANPQDHVSVPALPKRHVPERGPALDDRKVRIASGVMHAPTPAAQRRPRLRRRAFAGLVALAAGVSGLAVWGSVRVGSASVAAWPRERAAPDAEAQLLNIKRRLLQGEAGTMQALFPEGWLFSHLLYGYAWVNVGLLSASPAVRGQAVREARWVLQRAGC